MAQTTPGGCRLLICSIQPIPSIRIDGRKTTAAWRDSNQSAITCLAARAGCASCDGTNSGDSLTGSGFTLAWNRSTITGGDDCVYLIYRDGALISTRVKDAGFTGNQANITWSSITEADSGTYTVRAYNSYAGLSEPSNAVTFTYQA